MVDPQVITVSVVLRRPAPAIRTHTLASFLEMSSPAHRPCTTSISSHLPHSSTDHFGVRRGEGREKRESDARARRHQSTVPVEALHHHADLRAHRHHREGRGRPRRTIPVSVNHRSVTTANRDAPEIFAHHGAPEAPRC